MISLPARPRRTTIATGARSTTALLGGGGAAGRPANKGRRRKLSVPLVVLLVVQGLVLRHWWASRDDDGEGTKAALARIWPSTWDRPVGVGPGTTSTALRRRSDRALDAPFALSADPLPVHHVHEQIHFHNHPLSPHRPPPNQFLLSPKAVSSGLLKRTAPVISIVTATQNPRAIMLETAASVLGQSLQNVEWVIVDDHTTDPDSLAMLRQIARDPRVVIVPNTGAKGLSASRNVALRWILSDDKLRAGRRPKYLASLDDDDLYELTALEKTIWMLESNPEWDLGGFQVIKFNANNETVTMGLHSGAANFFNGNFVPNAAIYTTRAVINSGCAYDDVNFAVGGEDWDFWMCLAEHGHWGGTVPEPLYWYRGNPAAFRQSRWGNMFVDGFSSLKQRIHDKHPALAEPGRFPDPPVRPSRQLEAIVWDAPFETHLARFKKSIMFIVPWLYVGGADIGALHQIQLFAEQGYRVTIVCTLYRSPQGVELRPQVLQYTHDVHVLPSFLRASDIPRYIKYLVHSRGIEDVVMSNSQLVYEMLPALAEQMPHVKFVDYLHNEAYDGWKSGGYPTFSLISQRFLSRTVTCSWYLRDWLIQRGHTNPDAIGVVKLGIEVADFAPANATTRALAKRDLLDVPESTVVISVVGRLDPQKRSTLVPDIANALRRLGTFTKGDFLVVMLGDGPLKDEVKARVSEFHVGDFVRLVGTVEHPQAYLAATDIFLLPSMSEGISIAVAEAMAMALPVVTARAGALPEQLGELPGHVVDKAQLAGVLVDHVLDAAVDAPLYADELYRLIQDPELRAEFGANGRKNVESTFDWRKTLVGMLGEIKKAEVVDLKKARSMPNPAAHFALQNVLLENHSETDFAAAQSALKAPNRSGVGKDLQERCGETSSALTAWIDSVEAPQSCAKGGKLDAATLQRSAKFQCGAWCLFDLTTALYAGWAFDGRCFTPFDDLSPGWCKEFWSSRPSGVRLPKDIAIRLLDDGEGDLDDDEDD
ncbi:glycosyltransferase family 4 protein [Rhodotorula graminis WP1]|uniref:Glycosyltransferase family 4 protein n=1 Tax=Rhodotorula graminis (strain WP1) TaxID=578459 RepID=A0A0P9FCE2_RHOGW|nr:glycosyltransferase family 4 protein [Rhodotorula graminis WP1]KPV73364.1 glycosyltransferase family 4 protein [Rhodotorula graminis WP1]